MSSPEPLQGSIISAFKDCDEETIAKIRHYFTIWGEHLLDDPAPLTDEELEEHSDQLIFGTWDSDIRPREPAFQAPHVSQTRLQIGHFNQDLPKSTKAEAKWAEGLEHELFDLRVDLNKYNQFFPERKAGQPAFVRARPEYLQQQLAVPFDFIDRKGNWAPVGCIDFGTPGNKPSDILLASACKRAETAWANACDDWNSSLCVYLCRLDLYNKSRTTSWRQKLCEVHFRKVPKICGSMPTQLGFIQRVALVTGNQQICVRAGNTVFKARIPGETTNMKTEGM